MKSALVDSDIRTKVGRGRNAAIAAKWMEPAGSDSQVRFSPVSGAELRSGARVSEHETLRGLLEIGRRAGEYLRLYRKSHSVELGDALIAASDETNDAALWTRNHKHYPMKNLAFFAR